MDIFSFPGALLALNDLTILFNFARQIWPYIGEVITEIIGSVSRIAFLVKLAFNYDEWKRHFTA